MADDNAPDQAPAKPAKRGLPWGYLVFAVLILGVFATFVVAPDLPRGLLGSDPPRPADLGSSPARAGDISGGALSERELAAEMASLGQVRTSAPPPVVAAPVDTGPARPVDVAVSTDDEPRAAALLAEAEAAYQAMEWDKAQSTARRVAALKAKPSTKVRASDIERNAAALGHLFKELNDRDELNRNYETHPSLVRLVRPGSETLVVPIARLEAPYDPITGDPVAWIEAQRQVGKVKLLVKGARQFTPAEMDVEGYELVAADQAAIRAEAQQALSARAARVAADRSASRDAFAWYELGKTAYRNRLDDQVVRHLDKAIDLDPFLARSVREANAGILFGSLVAHMKNGNRQQAAAFMASIDRRYKDTDQAQQARLFYAGKTAELITAAREAAQREREAAEARQRERAERERQRGNEAAAKAIAAQKPIEEDEGDDDSGAPVSAEIAEARKLRDQGAKVLGEAVNMPATDARNKKYTEAASLLARAKSTYANYLNKNQQDSAAEAEMIETQKMWFTANKMKTL